MYLLFGCLVLGRLILKLRLIDLKGFRLLSGLGLRHHILGHHRKREVACVGVIFSEKALIVHENE